MSQPYENLYGVGLLDDLHNYFPALLYDSSSFRTVFDVLSYIQTMTRQRLDPFTIGSSRYFEREGLRPPVPVATTRFPVRESASFRDTAPLTTAILQMLLRPVDLPNLTPVIVRPTTEQLRAGTTVLSGNTLTENTQCAICQDVIQGDESIRKINRCGHLFHQNCVDTWFMTNVRCPVCRADIREVAES